MCDAAAAAAAAVSVLNKTLSRTAHVPAFSRRLSCSYSDSQSTMESAEDKSRPPVLVRREKRSSSTPRSPPAALPVDTSRSPSPSDALHDDVTSGRCERMQHVYPDVIIVERGRAGKTDMLRVRQEDSIVTDESSRNDDTEIVTECTMKLCHVGDVTDDDVNASLKDYTYMYKKDEHADSTTSYCNDRKLVEQSDYDASSDISSVTSSIVDYVRRSLTEVGVSTVSSESRDEQPPPLPVKTTTQRRAPLHCEIHGQQVGQDDVIASTWEPTHMTWDEVKFAAVSS